MTDANSSDKFKHKLPAKSGFFGRQKEQCEKSMQKPPALVAAVCDRRNLLENLHVNGGHRPPLQKKRTEIFRPLWCFKNFAYFVR